MKVSVTGGEGFIASHLVPALAREGHEVKVTVRREPAVLPKGVMVQLADVTTGDGLADAFADAEAVIHLAARNHVLREKSKSPVSEYQNVNVLGTSKVIHAASSAGARIFLHFSSVKAMGEESSKKLDETDRCSPTTPYGFSKLASEKVVRRSVEEYGLRAVIFRLPMVYGPRNPGNILRLITWAERGLPFPAFQPDNSRSMVYVGNVVRAVQLALRQAPPGVSTFLLKDREDYSTRTVYAAICHALGKTPLFLPIPSLLARFGGVISEDIRKATSSLRVSSAKIERELGFFPSFSLEQGILETIRWHKLSSR